MLHYVSVIWRTGHAPITANTNRSSEVLRRDKTNIQKINEAEKWEEIESEKARKRMSIGGSGGLEEGVDNCPHLEDGKTRDIVAKKVGFGSGKSKAKINLVCEA